jgi:hypothetical protein
LLAERSTKLLTVALLVAALLPPAGSVEPLLTLAVLASTVPIATAASTDTVKVKLALAPGAMEASVQVTVPVPPGAGVVQVKAGPPSCCSETNRVPAGSGSTSCTALATEGPAFATPRV